MALVLEGIVIRKKVAASLVFFGATIATDGTTTVEFVVSLAFEKI
jgi:hypothetical protein